MPSSSHQEQTRDTRPCISSYKELDSLPLKDLLYVYYQLSVLVDLIGNVK